MEITKRDRYLAGSGGHWTVFYIVKEKKKKMLWLIPKMERKGKVTVRVPLSLSSWIYRLKGL